MRHSVLQGKAMKLLHYWDMMQKFQVPAVMLFFPLAGAAEMAVYLEVAWAEQLAAAVACQNVAGPLLSLAHNYYRKEHDPSSCHHNKDSAWLFSYQTILLQLPAIYIQCMIPQ